MRYQETEVKSTEYSVRKYSLFLLKVLERENTENGGNKIFQEIMSVNFPELVRDTNT